MKPRVRTWREPPWPPAPRDWRRRPLRSLIPWHDPDPDPMRRRIADRCAELRRRTRTRTARDRANLWNEAAAEILEAAA